ncbi:hypothetical protein JIX59_03440 [Brevundimonas diminuta]|uniref:hypothetical protein n=1 Tax=Brevundimonas diminuta TaxID=293 RepID=UPI001906202E|nr:hypothetical protein [Brevundimonas diminuta]MBK1968385.1 hypothetical protein [Brevundimonas diminuta]
MREKPSYEDLEARLALAERHIRYQAERIEDLTEAAARPVVDLMKNYTRFRYEETDTPVPQFMLEIRPKVAVLRMQRELVADLAMPQNRSDVLHRAVTQISRFYVEGLCPTLRNPHANMGDQ